MITVVVVARTVAMVARSVVAKHKKTYSVAVSVYSPGYAMLNQVDIYRIICYICMGISARCMGERRQCLNPILLNKKNGLCFTFHTAMNCSMVGL